MAHILLTLARSLKEFRLLPGYTPADGRVQDVSLETKLCRQGEDYLERVAKLPRGKQGVSWPASFLSTGAILAVLSVPMAFFLTC